MIVSVNPHPPLSEFQKLMFQTDRLLNADALLACKPMPVRALNGLPESVIQLLCGMTITSPLITQR